MTKLTVYMTMTYLTMLLILMIITSVTMHPIFILILTIIYSMLICLNMSNWSANFIYSFILFLIMISGLLIIFLYFSSLISNERLTLKWNRYLWFSLILSPPILLNSLKNNTYINYISHNSSDIQPLMHMNQKLFSNIVNLYNYPYNYITLICILYLLVSLFTIIKLTSMNSKPMRKIY